ncbi:hypothetical protein D3C80_1533310 [compost metagenome]
MTATSNNLPISSTTASLQPVRYAGSTPSTYLPRTGGCSSKLRRLPAKIEIAWLSAFSVNSALTSLSIDGAISLLYASSMTVCRIPSVLD